MYWMPTFTFDRRPASVRARRGGHVEELGRADLDLVPPTLDLVRALAEHGVELPHRDGHRVRMSDPHAVEAVGSLAPLVGRDLLERLLVPRRVAQLGTNADIPPIACAAPVTESSRSSGVRPHEGRRHLHLVAIRQHELGPRGTSL